MAVLLGLRHTHMQVLRQAEGALPVDDAEVHAFGARAHLGRDLRDGHAEDLCGRVRVEILALHEGLDKSGVAREVRKQAQLYLAVVGAHEHAAVRHGEGLAYAAPQICAHGDVL